jgi:hypothetical protein
LVPFGTPAQGIPSLILCTIGNKNQASKKKQEEAEGRVVNKTGIPIFVEDSG